ncbi:MAG: phosphatase PAP2 family protein [Solirubrobacterales bacterium]
MNRGLPQSLQRRLDPKARFGLRATLFGLAVVLVAVPFAYLLFEVLGQGPFTRWDVRMAEAIHEWVLERQGFVSILDRVSLLGKPLWLAFIVTLAGIYVFVRGRRRLALYLVVAVAGGGLVDSAVKIAVNRPRPELTEPLAHAFGKSFPSGHAMSSMVTYGVLLLVLLPVVSRAWRAFAWSAAGLLVVLIGASRLMLGVHFVSDVLGGWILGIAWLSAVTAAFSIWRKEEGKPAVAVTEGVEPEAAQDLAPEHAVPEP